MASYTANYNLRKDASTDNYDVAVVNQNLDDIDAQMHQNEVASTTPFTGASSSANGEKGIVPRPLAGDEEKYLKGDGTWAEVQGGGGGSSTLSGLTDVTITSPTDGQGLVYDATNQIWINGDVGSGGGSGAEQDILYIASSMSETQISVDFTAYDEYIIYANDVLITQQIPQGIVFTKNAIEKAITDSTDIIVYGYGSASCAYSVTASGLTKTNATGSYAIMMIVGIKLGRGSSSASYSTTEHKVGTWIDGSDIYERTIHVNTSIPTQQYIPILSGESIELIGVNSDGTYFTTSSGQRWSAFAAYTNGGMLIYQEPNRDVTIYNNSGQVFTDGYVTIRYIKISTGGNS